MHTIFAVATPPGRSGVAVIRISGPEAQIAAKALCGNVPKSRGVRQLKDSTGDVLDEALVLNFEGTASFTGEPVVELQLHGSPAIVRSVIEVLSTLENLRSADAGEFTRRALENGKLDLAQVEGLADLIDAETEAQRIQAMRVFEGGLSDKSNFWRANLLRAAALLEATIDFADEDVPVDVFPEVKDLIKGTQDEIREEVKGSFVAERVTQGFEVAIVGPPNAGKSTLLNRLAGRDAAITSEIAGTTRDVIEVQMDLKGIPVTFIDTAGIRETDDEIERLGVERAIDRAKRADIRIFLNENNDLRENLARDFDIVRYSKSDLRDDKRKGISGKTGEGIDELIDELILFFEQRVSSVGVAIKERHRDALVACDEKLVEVLSQIEADEQVDLISEDLKVAVRSVDMIVGHVDVEDLLGEIFSSFCIGK